MIVLLYFHRTGMCDVVLILNPMSVCNINVCVREKKKMLEI